MTAKALRVSAALLVALLGATGPSRADISASLEQLFDAPSSRAHGLLGAGVALTNSESFTVNPATLASFGSDAYVSAVLYPVSVDYPYFDNVSDRYVGISGTPGRGAFGLPPQLRIGAGYYYTRQSDGVLIPVAESGRDADSEEPSFSTHNLAVAAAYGHRMSVALGMTARHYRSRLPGWGPGMEWGLLEENGWAFDLGAHGRLPLEIRLSPSEEGLSRSMAITPALGIVVRNLGGNSRYATPGVYADLPSSLRLGAAVGISRTEGALTWFEVTPVVEYRKLLTSSETSSTVYGGEIGLYETVWLRAAQADDDELDAWGFTISTAGIWKAIFPHRAGETAPSSGFSLRRMVAEVSHAREGDPEIKRTTVSLTYRF